MTEPVEKKDEAWKEAIGRAYPPFEFQYNPDRTILYALGIGCSQAYPNDLRYLYERDPHFAVFPTFAVIPTMELLGHKNEIPGIPTDLQRLIHAESYLEVLKPFPKSAKLISTGKITDIVDKKTMASLIIDIETKLADSGEKVAHNQFVIFFRGSGGFGGPRQSDKQRPLLTLTDEEQARTPDVERVERVGRDLNAIYRLSGDKNPLHIDAGFAAKVGFPQPILHGLCSLAICTRHVMAAYAKAEFSSIKVRFAKPVIPGQTLRTKMWRRPGGDNKFTVIFATSVEETGEVALNGQVEMIGA